MPFEYTSSLGENAATWAWVSGLLKPRVGQVLAAPERLMILAGLSQTLPNQRAGLPTASPELAWAAAHIHSN